MARRTRASRPDVTPARELAALNKAILTIAGELDLERVLRIILRSAARLVGAHYGALGMPDGRGGFGRFLTVGVSEARAAQIGTLPRVHGVLGALVTEGRPIRVKDIRRHPRFSWYPEHHPEMREFLGVPIRHQGEVLGNLFFSGSREGQFTLQHQRLVEMLAGHAGVAIATARLHAEAQQLAVLRERNRMARELHDAVSQRLFSLMYEARAARLGLERPSATTASQLEAIHDQAAAALEEMRSLVFALRPKSLERDGLAVTLTDHVEAVGRTHRIPIDTRIENTPRLALEQELALLRIAQEALHNAVKHSGSKRIAVHLSPANAKVHLEVVDTGRGFDPKKLSKTTRTMGLQAMRERAAGIGARLQVITSPGKGSTVRVILSRP